MNCKKYLIDKIKKWFWNINSKFIDWLNSEIEYYQDYGFWYGLKEKLFHPMSDEKFLKKMVNYELRHYKGVNYDYIINLPKKPEKPYKKSNQSAESFNKEIWSYLNSMKFIISNIYERHPIDFQDNWLYKYKFKTIKEYIQFEKYFYKMYPKTKSWKVDKEELARNFSWFSLQYGLSCDFKYEEIEKYKKNKQKKKWK